MGERKREGKRERDRQTKNRETHAESGTNQRDAQRKKITRTQSQEIPKTRTYNFFPIARVAFIGKINAFSYVDVTYPFSSGNLEVYLRLCLFPVDPTCCFDIAPYSSN